MTDQQIIETLATKVMGWAEGVSSYYPSWNPLQNIADAWQVVDRLVLEKGLPVEIQSSIREYRVSFNGEDWTYGNTAQEAISKAALMMIKQRSGEVFQL